jgi:hypothetical protein
LIRRNAPDQAVFSPQSAFCEGADVKNKGIERWTGVVLIGDGIAGMVWPREYLRKLKIGPEPINQVLESFAERPELTRAVCAVEVAFGLWVLLR